MSLAVHKDPVTAAAAAILSRVAGVIAARGHCVLAVPGGSTPGPVLNQLRKADPQLLGRLTLTLVDERHLPIPPVCDWHDLPAQSNTRLVYAELADGAPVPVTVHGWALPCDLESARKQLASTVPDPDVLLLGMGPDGHIGSLFPGHNKMRSTQRVISVEDSPKPPPQRLSMGLSLLNRAQHAVLVVGGEAKAGALARALALDPALPTTYLDGPTKLWIADPAAASQLPETS